MNRTISEPGRSGEATHRYVVGFYRLLERVTSALPDVLFEGCAGGGGRFDLGMITFVPQIWTSDQTDALERHSIQMGTSLLFPPETMGAHVSAVPNHQVGRVTPARFRGLTALPFAFGYELDLAKEDPADLNVFLEMSELYRTCRVDFLTGRFIRLAWDARWNPQSPVVGGVAGRSAWAIITDDGARVYVFTFNALADANDDGYWLPLRDLPRGTTFRDTCTGERYDAAELCNRGLWRPSVRGDFTAQLTILERM